METTKKVHNVETINDQDASTEGYNLSLEGNISGNATQEQEGFYQFYQVSGSRYLVSVNVLYLASKCV